MSRAMFKIYMRRETHWGRDNLSCSPALKEPQQSNQRFTIFDPAAVYHFLQLGLSESPCADPLILLGLSPPFSKAGRFDQVHLLGEKPRAWEKAEDGLKRSGPATCFFQQFARSSLGWRLSRFNASGYQFPKSSPRRVAELADEQNPSVIQTGQYNDRTAMANHL